MLLTSLIQARLAYAGMLAGLYVGAAPIARVDGYAAVTSLEAALLDGVLAGLAASIFAASLFAIWFEDRARQVLFWAPLGAAPAGVALSLLERGIDVFVLQPLVYAILGMLIASFIGFWLELLLCRRRPGAGCGCCDGAKGERT